LAGLAPHVRRAPLRRRFGFLVTVTNSLLAIAAIGAGAQASSVPMNPVRVDFDSPLVAIPAEHLGFTATTFDVEGGSVARNPADAAALGALGAGAVRIHLAPGPDGEVVSGALGGDRSIRAGRWLDTYVRMGLRPTVVVNLDRDDALAVLAAVRASGHDVRRYVLGNEMDANSRSDLSPQEYVQRFRDIAGAMRAIDPALEIGGPAPAYFEGLTPELVNGLVRAPAAERASFIDFHAYGAGKGETATAASAWRYAAQLEALRAMISDSRVERQVGEFNLNWSDEPQNGTQFQTVWVAAALGTILSEGAAAFLYGDKNAALGLVAGGVPKPSYWGIAMFTGAGLFRPFGSGAVEATSASSAVRVFASTRQRNIVLVNTGPVTHAAVQLDGFSGGEAEIWRSTDGEPVHRGTTRVGTRLILALPEQSVTTVVLSETPPLIGG
jgi:hypothetical protein